MFLSQACPQTEIDPDNTAVTATAVIARAVTATAAIALAETTTAVIQT